MTNVLYHSLRTNLITIFACTQIALLIVFFLHICHNKNVLSPLFAIPFFVILLYPLQMIVSNFFGSCIAAFSLSASLVSLNYFLKSNYADLLTHLILLVSFAQILCILLQRTKLKKNVVLKKTIVSLFAALLEFCAITALVLLLQNNSLPVVICTFSLLTGLAVLINSRLLDFHCFALFVIILLTFQLLSTLESYEKNWCYIDPLDIERNCLPVSIPLLLMLFVCVSLRLLMLIYSKTVVLLQDCEFFTAVFLFVAGLCLLVTTRDDFFASFAAIRHDPLPSAVALASFTIFYLTVFRYKLGRSFGLVFTGCMFFLHLAYIVFGTFFVKTILEQGNVDAYYCLLCVHSFAFLAVLDIGQVFARRPDRQTNNRQEDSNVDATAEAQDLST